MSEKTVGIIPHLLQPTGGIGSIHYTLIVTDQRLIIAQFTTQMMNEALTQSRNKRGTGILGGLLAGRVLTSGNIVEYTNKYWSMTPTQILAESSSNFDLPLSSISAARVNYEVIKSRSDDDAKVGNYVLVIESAYGGRSFIFDADPQDMTALRQVLGSKMSGSGRPRPIRPLSTIAPEINQSSETRGSMRFCPNCGQQVIPNTNFCSKCGNPLR